MMKIGEIIAYLRASERMSPEQLAERLNVSVSSVSQWETDQAQPQIHHILKICEIFRISTDTLLQEEPERNLEFSPAPGLKIPFENRFFGTDGFRGEANLTISAEQAFRVGRFLGWYYASPLSGCRTSGYRPRIILGKDTRLSSYMLEYALAAGLTCSGADAYMLHVTTTPSVSYVTRQENFDCGIMISASHNPFYDNGIKLVNRYGEKMEVETLSMVEAYLAGNLAPFELSGIDLPLAQRENVGAVIDYAAGRNRYIGYLISLASHSYKNIHIGLDCANGSSWMIAPSVFEALGTTVSVIGARPDGKNINREIGSTHTEALRALVRSQHLDVGFAFDGDADRCIAVDEQGNEVDGDKILYILARRLQDKGNLNRSTIVDTVMSNRGLTHSLQKIGISCVHAAVGDQNVYDRMNDGEYMLGGEPSGHIILQKYATTGDGILTAIMLMEEIMDRKQKLSKLAAPVTLYPQILKNIRVTDKTGAAADPIIREKLREWNERFGDRGRILLRASGTEPVMRIMAEGEDSALCRHAVETIAALLRDHGWENPHAAEKE